MLNSIRFFAIVFFISQTYVYSMSTPAEAQRKNIDDLIAKSEDPGMSYADNRSPRHLKISVGSGAMPSNEAATPVQEKTLEVTTRSLEVINLPQGAEQVFVKDPNIADVHLASPGKLYVYGRTLGSTEIVVATQNATANYRYIVNVKSDQKDLQRLIKKIAPNDSVHVVGLPEGVLLEGSVHNTKTAEDIRGIAQSFVGSKGTVINQLVSKNANQIHLNVKIAEVKRTLVNNLGINWGAAATGGNFRFGVLTGREPIDLASGSFLRSTSSLPSIGARFVDSNNNIANLIDALAKESLATVLAEPNLITRSGEVANFLVGGEFPYPVAQGVGASATVTIQFKQFGISLSFLPIVLGNTISLKVKVEVSDIDTTIFTRDQAGNTVPSLRVRRAESTMEMGNGQSMAMAGLLSDETTAGLDSVQGLASLPILGALFRSHDFQNKKTELVITVTPYVVQPIDNAQDLQLPTAKIHYAKLIDRVFTGELEENSPKTQKAALSGESEFYY